MEKGDREHERSAGTALGTSKVRRGALRLEVTWLEDFCLLTPSL